MFVLLWLSSLGKNICYPIFVLPNKMFVLLWVSSRQMILSCGEAGGGGAWNKNPPPFSRSHQHHHQDLYHHQDRHMLSTSIFAFTLSPSSFLHLPLCLVSCPLGSCRWLLPPFPWTRKPPILRWGKGKLEKWTRVGSNRSIQCTLYTCTGNRGAPNQNKPIQNASCKLGFRI